VNYWNKMSLYNILHRTILEFIKDLRDNLVLNQSEKSDLILVEVFVSTISKEQLMAHVVRKILPYSEAIKNREENFFLSEKGNIFSGISETKINSFSTIIKNSNTEDKSVIWSYLDTICEIAEQYKKRI